MTNDARFEARVRYKRGMDIEALIGEMIADGIDADAARSAVAQVSTRLRNEDRRDGFVTLGFGLFIAVIGLVVTLWTMSQGSVFVIAYGALVVGPGLVLLGISKIANAGKDISLARQGVSSGQF